MARRFSVARYLDRGGEAANLGGVTELRIHGVGGTTPESMLFDPHPALVAGDDTAGFYRSDDLPDRHLEAYSWGGLTSREATRALWLLLLPFSIMNVAGWVQRSPVPTPTGQGDPRRTAVGRLVLVLSAGLTSLLAAGLSLVTIDLLAYQCGADAACAGKRWWLAPLTPGPIAGYSGRRVALGILATTIVLFGFAYLARRSRGRYEATPMPAGALDGTDRPVLFRASTWRGSERVLRLGRFHRSAAFATVAAMGATATADLADAVGQSAVPATALALLAALTVIATLLALAFDLRALARPLVVVATGALVVSVVLACALPAGTRPAARLVIQRGPELIFGLELALLLVLGFVILVQSRSGSARPALPDAFRWATPLVLAAISVFMTGSVLAGITVRVADLLGTPVALPDGTTQAVEILYPVSFDWVSLAFTVTVIALVLQGLAFWLVVGRVSGKEVEAIQDETSPRNDEQPRQWTMGIAKARHLTARLRDLDRFVSVTVLSVLVLVAVSYPVFVHPQRGGVSDYPAIAGRWHWAQVASTWAVVLLPVGGMWLLTDSWRGVQRRKSIGVVWDLATYWPRWFNPWAPPCYAERVIPDFQVRLCRLVDEGGGSVVVSAHSQGTVLAVTALETLPEHYLARIALVTYGSPLAHLYPWLFPAHWGTLDAAALASRLAPMGDVFRWQHFWRRTDPIGGPLFVRSSAPTAGCSEELPDPRRRDHAPGDPWPAVAGHSHYLEDPRVVEATSCLARALAALPATDGRTSE